MSQYEHFFHYIYIYINCTFKPLRLAPQTPKSHCISRHSNLWMSSSPSTIVRKTCHLIPIVRETSLGPTHFSYNWGMHLVHSSNLAQSACKAAKGSPHARAQESNGNDSEALGIMPSHSSFSFFHSSSLNYCCLGGQVLARPHCLTFSVKLS